MHYWNSVLKEVRSKNRGPFLYTDRGRLEDKTMDPFSVTIDIDFFDAAEKQARDLREYYLGDDYPSVYVTKREAESIFWITQGYSIPKTACQLGLS